MTRYSGTIKTRTQALSLARKLRKNGTPRAMDAAKILEGDRWRMIASRPALQPALIAMANTTPLSRKGGIIRTR